MNLYIRIQNFLQNKHYSGEDFVWGGTLERYFGEAGVKPSNVARRCRELVEKGAIERREAKAPNGRMAVQYRIKRDIMTRDERMGNKDGRSQVLASDTSKRQEMQEMRITKQSDLFSLL